MDRKFLDINAIAVFLDEGHLGHPYLREALLPGFRGAFQLILSVSLLIRARWVLVSQWGVDPVAADRVLEALARVKGPVYVEGDGGTVLRAIEMSRELSHDIYDCFVVALAKSGDATHLVTTDAGLRPVCEEVGIQYENPVPLDILKRFGISGRG